MKSFLKRLRRDKDGMSMVEFALISMPMTAAMFGALEVGYQAYVTSMVQGTIQQMARFGSLEGKTETDVKQFAYQNLGKFVESTDVDIDTRNYRTFADMGKPEKITTDTAPIGQFNLGDCFVDRQTNNEYDMVMDGESGLGFAESVVRYTLKVKFKRLSPVADMVGMENPKEITRVTMIRNEPFQGVESAPTICTNLAGDYYED